MNRAEIIRALSERPAQITMAFAAAPAGWATTFILLKMLFSGYVVSHGEKFLSLAPYWWLALFTIVATLQVIAVLSAWIFSIVTKPEWTFFGYAVAPVFLSLVILLCVVAFGGEFSFLNVVKVLCGGGALITAIIAPCFVILTHAAKPR